MPWARVICAAGPPVVSGEGDQQVLDADVFVVEALGLDVGALEQLHDSGRDGELDHVVAEFGRGVDGGVGVGAQPGTVDVEGVEEVVGEAVLERVAMLASRCSTSHWAWRFSRTSCWEASSSCWAWLVNRSRRIIVVAPVGHTAGVGRPADFGLAVAGFRP